MAPTYNLGDCPDCCPSCPYSVEIRVSLSMQSGNAYLDLSDSGGIFLQGGGTLIFDAGGGFQAQFVVGAQATYDGAGTLTVSFYRNGQTEVVHFTNVTVTEVEINNRRDYSANTCWIE